MSIQEKNSNPHITGILFVVHVSVQTLHYPKLQFILYKGFVISTNIEKKHFWEILVELV